MSTMEPETFAYRRDRFLSDWLRAAIGIGIATIVFIAAPASIMAAIIAAILGLAALYLAHHAIARYFARIFVTENGVVLRNDAPPVLAWMLPRSRAIAWDRIDRFKLRFFATRRDRTDGWFELTLGGGGETIRIDDRLQGFDAILERARAAADARSVEYDQATFHNLDGRGDFEKKRREA